MGPGLFGRTAVFQQESRTPPRQPSREGPRVFLRLLSHKEISGSHLHPATRTHCSTVMMEVKKRVTGKQVAHDCAYMRGKSRQNPNIRCQAVQKHATKLKGKARGWCTPILERTTRKRKSKNQDKGALAMEESSPGHLSWEWPTAQSSFVFKPYPAVLFILL